MRQWRKLVALTLSVGCSFNSEGVGGGNSGAPGSGDSGDRGEDSNPGDESGDTGETGETTDDPTIDSSLPSSADSAEESSDSDTGEPEYPDSCEAVRLNDPLAPSGIYEIAPPDANVPVPFDVYCDMVLDGGGWTLVARSVDGPFEDDHFGWGASRGAVNDLAQPYALDVVASAIAFDQLLVGNRGGGMEWGGHVYRVALPPDFMSLADNAVEAVSVNTVVGDCTPGGGPTMLRWVGHTAATRNIFFRDSNDYDIFGLRSRGFDTFYDILYQCDRGGDLDGDDGMVFVR